MNDPWNGLRYGDKITVILNGVAMKAHYRRPHTSSPTDTFWYSAFDDGGRVLHREEVVRNEDVTWCRGHDDATAKAMVAAFALGGV